MLEYKIEEEGIIIQLKVDGMKIQNITKILDSVREATQDEMENAPQETQSKEEKLKEGYSTFISSKQGIHRPKSEYELAGDVESTQNDYGVKEYDGELKYQLFYICHDCGHKGKRYIPKGSIYTNCHECGKRMNIRPATTNGFGYTENHKDEFSNYFIAGSFERDFRSNKQVIAN